MTRDGQISFRPKRLSTRPLYGALLLGWLLILVVVVVFLVMLGVERASGEFEEHAGQIHGELTNRLEFNEVALNGFAAFLAVADRDERDAITHFASAILHQTPHIHSLSVVDEVQEAHVGTYLNEMQRAGYPDIAIRVFDFNGTRRWHLSDPRPVYYPLSLIVHLDGSYDELLGIDIGQIGAFSDAVMRALNTHGSHASGPLKFSEEGQVYSVFRRVDATASNGSARDNRSLAMLMVRTTDLLPASVLTQEYDYHMTLVAQSERSGAGVTILDIPSQPAGTLATLLLPKLYFSRHIASSVPPMTFTIERCLTWEEINLPIISWVMFAATLTLLLLHVYMTAHRHSESRRLELEELLRYKAHHDELTGLPNRTLIMDRLEQGIRDAHRDHQSMAVLFLDLNGFKPVNDTYGHAAGDRVLHEVAQRLRTVVRDRDTVGRISGDEFILIFADTDRPGCDVVIEKIRHGFDAPFLIDAETNLAIGVSIGVSVYPDDGATPSELMRFADNEMYRHKPGHR